jgi:hypothetical protein
MTLSSPLGSSFTLASEPARRSFPVIPQCASTARQQQPGMQRHYLSRAPRNLPADSSRLPERGKMKRAMVIAALSLSMLYIVDYLSLRYRFPRSRQQFGSVKVQRYYAVRKKDRKTEFFFDQPETQVCVHSLFPHFGDPPCWYASRRSVKRTDI